MTSSSAPPETAPGTAALSNDDVDSFHFVSFAKQVKQGWEAVCNDDGNLGFDMLDEGNQGLDMFDTGFNDAEFLGMDSCELDEYSCDNFSDTAV